MQRARVSMATGKLTELPQCIVRALAPSASTYQSIPTASS